MYDVYVIYNSTFRKIYIGYTHNLKNRIEQHNEGFRNSFTSRFKGKWILVYSEKCATSAEARIREKELKSFRGRESIKKYIPG